MRSVYVLVALAGLTGCAAEERPWQPVSLGDTTHVTTVEKTGSGAFRFAIACPDGAAVSAGSCSYGNVAPEDRLAGIADDGWFCAGSAPEVTPFGWVIVSATCESAP